MLSKGEREKGRRKGKGERECVERVKTLGGNREKEREREREREREKDVNHAREKKKMDMDMDDVCGDDHLRNDDDEQRHASRCG